LKILLTGADGFTGRVFAGMATTAGHRVVGLQANLTDALALREEVLREAPDSVLHLAAISFVGHADENAFYAVNVVGTTNLLAALAALPERPKKVVLASSANVYGNCIASPIAETEPAAPVNHYAMSKLAMEHMARNYADRLPIVIARPFNYTGPGQSIDFVIPKLVDHFAHRAPSIALGNLDVEREFNDVELVCSAYLTLINYGEPSETYNICSGQPHTLKHVIDTLSRIADHQLRVEINPAFMRANEVRRLCGNPAKLQKLVEAHGDALSSPSLEKTLKRMLLASHARP
jgi:GDP-6-deoxy-D-talose 4-dehydrogenase